MEKAILSVLKKGATLYTFPTGQLMVVDLFCDGQPVAAKEVIVDNAMVEYAAYTAGRVQALKLVSECETIYALGSARNIDNLKNCCNEMFNYTVSLSCTPAIGSTVTVYDVLGNSLGTVTTPAAYATMWNASTTNSYLGTLYEKKGWTFTLNSHVGAARLLALECTSTAPVVTGCPTVTMSSTGAGNMRADFTALANTNYGIHVYSDAAGNNELTGGGIGAATFVNNTNADNPDAFWEFNGLAGGVYYVEVRDVTKTEKCPIQAYTVVDPTPVTVQWDYFADEPTNLGGLTLTKSQAHTLGQDAALNISDMPNNSWVVFKYPATEANYLSWENDVNNYGPIPDSNFAAAVQSGAFKYIKSQVGLTLTTTNTLIFMHSA